MVAHYKVGKRRQMILPNAAPPVLSAEEARLRRRHILGRWRARKRQRLWKKISGPVFRGFAATLGFLKRFPLAIFNLTRRVGQGASKGLAGLRTSIISVLSNIANAAKAALARFKAIVTRMWSGLVASVAWGWAQLVRGIRAIIGFVRRILQAVVNLATQIAFGFIKLMRAIFLAVKAIAAWAWRGAIKLVAVVRTGAKTVAVLAGRGLVALGRFLTHPRLRSVRAVVLYGVCAIGYSAWYWQADIASGWNDWQRERAREAAVAEALVPIVIEDDIEDEVAIQPIPVPERREVVAADDTVNAESDGRASGEMPNAQPIDLDGVIDDILEEDEARSAEWAEAQTVLAEETTRIRP